MRTVPTNVASIARGAYKSLACRNLLLWPDTGQHRSPAKILNFAMETKAKKLHCLSSYQGLNRLSLGQISELLLPRRERYCKVKLKWPDTGQHTVRLLIKKTIVQLHTFTHLILSIRNLIAI